MMATGPSIGSPNEPCLTESTSLDFTLLNLTVSGWARPCRMASSACRGAPAGTMGVGFRRITSPPQMVVDPCAIAAPATPAIARAKIKARIRQPPLTVAKIMLQAPSDGNAGRVAAAALFAGSSPLQQRYRALAAVG